MCTSPVKSVEVRRNQKMNSESLERKSRLYVPKKLGGGGYAFYVFNFVLAIFRIFIKENIMYIWSLNAKLVKSSLKKKSHEMH